MNEEISPEKKERLFKELKDLIPDIFKKTCLTPNQIIFFNSFLKRLKNDRKKFNISWGDEDTTPNKNGRYISTNRVERIFKIVFKEIFKELPDNDDKK